MFVSQQLIPLEEVCGRYINAKRHAGALFMLHIGIKLWSRTLQLQAISFSHMPHKTCHTTVLTACSRQAVWRARVVMQQHGKGMTSDRPELTSLTDEPVKCAWHCVLDPVVPWHVKRGRDNLGQEHSLIITKEKLQRHFAVFLCVLDAKAQCACVWRLHISTSILCDILVYITTAILHIFRAC